jgi:hypothetical protein
MNSFVKKQLLAMLMMAIGTSFIFAQDLTGIWRGSFVATDSRLNDIFNLAERYKYEVQIDNKSKSFTGVTYSYKTTVFYGKASAKGTINPRTRKVILEELKLLELKMNPGSTACWMRCFLQYTKNGNEEFLEGKYSSFREEDSTPCGKGTVMLRRVFTSDFYKEPFVVKKEKLRAAAIASKKKMGNILAEKPTTSVALAKPKPKANKPPSAKVLAKPSKPLPTKSPTATIVRPKIDSNQQAITIVKPQKPINVPTVLKDRKNEVVQTIDVGVGEVTIDIYDNGTVDHDTVSVYLDKKMVLSKQMLTTKPLSLTINMLANDDKHELVMVADNLGDFAPNTSLMVVKAAGKTYEVRISSTEQQNAVVVFKNKKE